MPITNSNNPKTGGQGQVLYTTNSHNLRVRIGYVGESFDVPVIAKIYPEDAPYYNEDTKEYQAYQAFSIRKLTEGECLRLMDVPEDMIVALCQCKSLSRSAIYKLAGNSIVVACLRLIFNNIYNSPEDNDAQLTLFPEPPFRAAVPKTINLVTLCSGYDSQLIALRQAVAEMKATVPDGSPSGVELLAWSEFDPDSKRPLDSQPAVVAHNVLFPEYSDRNVGDMTKVDWVAVKASWPQGTEVDILTYSTPCQSISNAGKREGMKEGSGTRSSIVFYTKNAIEVLRPKFLLQENVRAIINDVNIEDFKEWQRQVRELGYTNYFTIMNAKDYGVPQNRERMFMVSVRNDLVSADGYPLPPFIFPKPFTLDKCIADVLDEEVDTHYFLQPDSVRKFLEKNEEDAKKKIIYLVTDHHLSLEELQKQWQQ